MFNNNKKENLQPIEVRNSSNIIGKETCLEGTLSTVGNLRVEGKVIGGITSKAKVVLSNTAWVKGNIEAQNAEIGGEIEGVIKISGLLTLKPTAVIQGDIITNKLVFEEGAKFNGKCQMSAQVQEAAINAQNTLQKSHGSLLQETKQSQKSVIQDRKAY